MEQEQTANFGPEHCTLLDAVEPIKGVRLLAYAGHQKGTLSWYDVYFQEATSTHRLFHGVILGQDRSSLTFDECNLKLLKDFISRRGKDIVFTVPQTEIMSMLADKNIEEENRIEAKSLHQFIGKLEKFNRMVVDSPLGGAYDLKEHKNPGSDADRLEVIQVLGKIITTCSIISTDLADAMIKSQKVSAGKTKNFNVVKKSA